MHFKTVCRCCSRVVTQCRCPSTDKRIDYVPSCTVCKGIPRATVVNARRRGLLQDVKLVFASAREMVGGTCHPDEMDEERERLRVLEREVLAILKSD